MRKTLAALTGFAPFAALAHPGHGLDLVHAPGEFYALVAVAIVLGSLLAGRRP